MILIYSSVLLLVFTAVRIARCRMNRAEAHYVELAKKINPAPATEDKRIPPQGGSGTSPPFNGGITIGSIGGPYVVEGDLRIWGQTVAHTPITLPPSFPLEAYIAERIEIAMKKKECDKAEARYGVAAAFHDRLAGALAWLLRHPSKFSLTALGEVDFFAYLVVAQYYKVIDFGRTVEVLAKQVGM